MKNNIKKERLNIGLTQKDLADQFNQFIAKKNIDLKPVSYAAISRWESGENEPKYYVWQALSSFFHVDIAYLRGYSSGKVTFENEHNTLFTKRLYFYLNQKNMTMNRVATLAGLSATTLSSIINRGSSPRIDTVFKICEGLGISFTEFFDFPPYNEIEK